MAKQKLEINKKEFQKVVDELESKHEFKNTSELWKAIEETTWAKNLKPRPLTWAVAYQRAKELGIITKAKAGKRGRKKGEKIPNAGRKKGGRSKKMKFYQASFDKMRIELPLINPKVIDRAEEGSLTAAIKAKCMDCTCQQPAEIKRCTIFSCSLYPHRPYKLSKEKERLNQFLKDDKNPWKGYYEEIGDEDNDNDLVEEIEEEIEEAA